MNENTPSIPPLDPQLYGKLIAIEFLVAKMLTMSTKGQSASEQSDFVAALDAEFRVQLSLLADAQQTVDVALATVRSILEKAISDSLI